ncbi:MAG: hypothetical protein Unbinned706contig1000_46 [Prokaryotic dsDNA virus sp.]|nr:MAG: hypothetical protein Unbinned706contig1000_46 [Prokaryotic dsDNA virus sp.]|tara:strand:+ start:36260 stop:36442 length:183 start_codon:yes stop_codon:yes gene_type:complete
MSELHERFTLDEGCDHFPVLRFMLDGKEITYKDLVKISNQLANALLDAGMVFKLEQGVNK